VGAHQVPQLRRSTATTCAPPRIAGDVPALSGGGNRVGGAARTGSIQAERPERREGALSCPHCGRTVEAIWITCPWCEEPLRGRERARNGAADLDVRRDTKRTGWLLVLLAVIGGLGVGGLGLTALASVPNAVNEPPYEVLGVLAVPLLALLFLAGISTLIVFVRSRGNPDAISFRRVAVGTLALAGGIILVIILLYFAAFVFLFIVCYGTKIG